jgi:hypothetical protein
MDGGGNRGKCKLPQFTTFIFFFGYIFQNEEEDKLPRAESSVDADQ